MPELPEVETVCRGLSATINGQQIKTVHQRRKDLRIPFPDGLPEKLENRRIDNITRRAKYIVINLDDGMALLIHLGMSGRIMIHDTPQTPGKHDHLVLTTSQNTQVILNDTRRFGMVGLCTQNDLNHHPFFEHLGPEPLGNHFSAPYLAEKLKNKKSPIKNALLDQRIVAGLGNIYVCDALYYAGIAPTRRANTLTEAEIEKLVPAIRDVLERAIEAGGSSLRDYVKTDGELGYFQHHWAVYGKEGEPCPDCTCDQKIKRITQSGRSTFYCPEKQV